MDKIDISDWEGAEVRTQIMRCMVGINELVEGYNEIMKWIENDKIVWRYDKLKFDNLIKRLNRHIDNKRGDLSIFKL